MLPKLCTMSNDKKTLRRQFLSERAAQSAADKQKADGEIARRVLESEAYRRAACVFAYVSTVQEIDTRALLRAALAAGKTVCVPLCGAAGEMTARQIASLDELRPGAYGIEEPDAAAREIVPDDIDLVLVPALACDRQGYRLGYGGGTMTASFAGLGPSAWRFAPNSGWWIACRIRRSTNGATGS